MPFQSMLRWCARWLERRGLSEVANALDARLVRLGNVDAMHALARRLLRRGDIREARSTLEDALARRPGDASLWCSIGAAHRHLDDFSAARQAYEKAIALRPEYPEVLSNLGEWCIAQKRPDEALEWFDRALQCSPDFFEAQLNRVAALFEAARYGEARTAAEELIATHPTRAEAYLNLGNILVHTGKAKQGIRHYKKALELQPHYAEAHFNLATLLGSRDDLVSAISYLERLIKERGETVHYLGLLAAAHQAAGNLSKAEQLCRTVLEKQPDNINGLVTLGSCLSAAGDARAAVALYERVVELDGSQASMGSNVLFESNNLDNLSREQLYRMHCDWAERFAAPLAASREFSERDRDPSRKLRIGYVSGDFVRHPVGFLLRDILKHHQKEKFEIHCFSMVVRPEDILPELRAAADAWEDVFFLSDEELDEMVRKAGIDILVDLSGHTGFNRLLVFARRPAPVQVEWIGYFHSTGMREIDYFITDPYTTPADSGQLFSEIPVHLPHTRFCYGPPEYAGAVAPPPVASRGVITFGSFNRLSKVTNTVVEAWASILAQVPDSRLLLKAGALGDQFANEHMRRRFEKLGIDPARLELREGSSHAEMFAQYGEVDIALDTFPFNGGMTTLEALWMGVPVVTIAGNTVVSRQTVAALANLGLDRELAFANPGTYVAGAVALAHDRQRLAELRASMRQVMEASPLRQSAQFARDLEALYRRMWQAWCDEKRLDRVA